MQLIVRLGWRNLWRNPRRSMISVGAIAAALIILVLLLGLSEGLKEQMLANGTSLLTGEFQIHDADYLPDRSLYDTIGEDQGFDPDSQLQRLASTPGVRALAPRVHGFALLSTGDRSAGAQLLGIDPDRERRVSTFLEGLSSGRRLSQSPDRSIVLGELLARELQAEVGDEVAAVTQAADGSLGNDLFVVAGTVRTGLSHVDRSLAVFHYADLQELLALGGDRFHEVAGRLKTGADADEVAAALNGRELLPEGAGARSWGDLIPHLRDYLQLFDGMYGFIIGLVALFAALGILNTMLMVVFERTREIGMLTALGLAPGQIVASIVLETLVLVALGVVVGLAGAAVMMQPLSSSGLDLSRWTGELAIMNTRLDPVIRFHWKWVHLAASIVGIAAGALLASILPAVRAARLNPVKALSEQATV